MVSTSPHAFLGPSSIFPSSQTSHHSSALNVIYQKAFNISLCLSSSLIYLFICLSIYFIRDRERQTAPQRSHTVILCSTHPSLPSQPWPWAPAPAMQVDRGTEPTTHRLDHFPRAAHHRCVPELELSSLLAPLFPSRPYFVLCPLGFTWS